jgi:hypothetical protein
MTDAPRQIAVVTAITGYDGLNGAFRARAEELNITRDDVDVLGGLTRGHGSKILAAYPQKAIGRTTLGPILHALKLKLIVVPDDDVIWKDEPRGRRIKRPVMLHTAEHGVANMPESRALQAKVVRDLLHKHACKGLRLARAARNTKLSPKQRRRIAKHAANARWHKPKLIEVTGEQAQQLRKQLETQPQKPAPNGNKPAGELTSAQRIAPSRARSTRC